MVPAPEYLSDSTASWAAVIICSRVAADKNGDGDSSISF